MLHQTLPGTPEAVEDARTWIKKALSARQRPQISVADAVHVGTHLVATAVRHTPKDGVVEIKLIPARNGGLVIEVKDPNSPAAPHVGCWAKISCMVRGFGTSTSMEGGHIAWCELPEAITSGPTSRPDT
ncbi:ATP-binding protein [Nonomuraea sp. B5E05]|uniref:ATP-binding protein n=1 Tax=Nonomuraea sp. B5E05 TaxID=3153569 RepID=UPI003261406F